MEDIVVRLSDLTVEGSVVGSVVEVRGRTVLGKSAIVVPRSEFSAGSVIYRNVVLTGNVTSVLRSVMFNTVVFSSLWLSSAPVVVGRWLSENEI